MGHDRGRPPVHLGTPAGVERLPNDQRRSRREQSIETSIRPLIDARPTSARPASAVATSGLGVEPGDPDRADAFDPRGQRRRAAGSRPTTATTPASRSRSRARSDARPGDRPPARPGAAVGLVEGLEPVEAPGQLDRVVIPRVGQAVAHRDVRRQLLAEPDHPPRAARPRAQARDHGGHRPVVRRVDRRVEAVRRSRTARRPSARASAAGPPTSGTAPRRARAASAARAASSAAVSQSCRGTWSRACRTCRSARRGRPRGRPRRSSGGAGVMGLGAGAEPRLGLRRRANDARQSSDGGRGPERPRPGRRDAARRPTGGRARRPPSRTRPKATQSVSRRWSVTFEHRERPEQVDDRREPERPEEPERRQAGEERDPRPAPAGPPGQRGQPDQGRQPGEPAGRFVEVVDARGPGRGSAAPAAGCRRRKGPPCRRCRARRGRVSRQGDGRSRSRSAQTGLLPR